MGAKYLDVCYPTQVEARSVACTTFDIKAMAGADLYTSECVSNVYSNPMMIICKRINGGVCTTVEQPWPNTPDCSHDGGVSLSYDYFLVAITLLCIVWGGKQLIKLFDQPHAD